MSIQGWFPLELTGLISLQSKGLSRVFFSTTVQNHQFFGAQPFFIIVQLSYPYVTTGKTIAFAIWTFVSKLISQLFSTLSRFVIVFLPRSKCLFISWLQSPSTVILEPKKIKSLLSFDFHFWVGTFWSQNYLTWVDLSPNLLSYSHIDLVFIFLSDIWIPDKEALNVRNHTKVLVFILNSF